MSEPLRLRVERVPALLAVVRLGATMLADDPLAPAGERTYERWGVWGFSVLEVPNGDDYGSLVRLRPEVGQRRQLLVADGHALIRDGFPVIPTLDHPHWTVFLAEATVEQVERVRRHFRGHVPTPPGSGDDRR